MRIGKWAALFGAIVGLICLLATGLWYVGRTALALGLFWLAAQNSIDRTKAMHSGYARIPQARQIDELIGEAQHSVVNEGDETEAGIKEEWISEVYFGGRYELVMTVDIRVDRRTSDVSNVIGPPRFHLLEIESVQILSDGRFYVSYRTSAEFSAGDWDRVVAANGDFAVIGITIEKTSPIPNFDELVQESRRRTRLRHAR